jgi:hypothetical protein
VRIWNVRKSGIGFVVETFASVAMPRRHVQSMCGNGRLNELNSLVASTKGKNLKGRISCLESCSVTHKCRRSGSVD